MPTPANGNDRVLLTTKETAFHLGLSQFSLRSARSNKRNLRMPPYVKLNGRVYYDVDDLLDWAYGRPQEPVGPGRKAG